MNTGNNLLYLVVSALLGFMAVSGILGKANIEALELRLAVPDEIYAGLPTLVTVHLINRKRWLPAFLLQTELAGERLLFPVLDRRGGAAAGSVTVTFPRRGRRRLEPAAVRSIFPINFFVRSRLLPVGHEVLVFPAPRRCPGVSGSGMKAAGEAPERSTGGAEGELSRIADYSGSEPLKRIHWKLSARHDQLKVKQFSPHLQEPVMVDLAALPGNDVEERLRCAVFLINRYARENRPVGLQLAGKVLPPAAGRPHRLKLLAELARHGQG